MPISAEMTEMVLTVHTNTHGNLLGGQLVHWMDMVAALTAKKQCHQPVVTISIDFLRFLHPARIGDYIHLVGTVTRTFNTTLEIEVECFIQNPIEQTPEKLNGRGYFTFMAVTKTGKPVSVPPYTPDSPQMQQKWEAAGKRRELRFT
ncbi:acyl-CoA thioesterase [candidate division KSB1 bacterium]|nr:acyl-CoA thioesterase [candidate division KSB1 bacterium]